MNDTTNTTSLLDAVLAWWRDHESDCVSYDAGDGFTDERNVYDEPPEFVRIAIAALPPPALDAPVVAERLAIKLLVAAGFVTQDKANEALNIAHGFDKGTLAPPAVDASMVERACRAFYGTRWLTMVGQEQARGWMRDALQAASPVAAQPDSGKPIGHILTGDLLALEAGDTGTVLPYEADSTSPTSGKRDHTVPVYTRPVAAQAVTDGADVRSEAFAAGWDACWDRWSAMCVSATAMKRDRDDYMDALAHPNAAQCDQEASNVL